MSATSLHDAPEPAAPTLATAAWPREPLLDPFVCGIREIEEPPPAPSAPEVPAATAAPGDPATGGVPPER